MPKVRSSARANVLTVAQEPGSTWGARFSFFVEEARSWCYTEGSTRDSDARLARSCAGRRYRVVRGSRPRGQAWEGRRDCSFEGDSVTEVRKLTVGQRGRAGPAGGDSVRGALNRISVRLPAQESETVWPSCDRHLNATRGMTIDPKIRPPPIPISKITSHW